MNPDACDLSTFTWNSIRKTLHEMVFFIVPQYHQLPQQ
jgi:hypothetical protein